MLPLTSLWKTLGAFPGTPGLGGQAAAPYPGAQLGPPDFAPPASDSCSPRPPPVKSSSQLCSLGARGRCTP